MGDAVEWLHHEIRRRGLARIHLAGYSMGGRIALSYALEHPEDLASLSLIGAHPGIRDAEERAERARWDDEMAKMLEADGLHAFVNEWMKHPVLADQLRLAHSRVVAAKQGRLAHTSAGLASAFRSLGTGRQEPMWERLAQLTPPTLFLAGEDDAKYVGVGEAFVDAAPNAALEVISGAGHNTLLEQPTATIEAIRTFIERVEST